MKVSIDQNCEQLIMLVETRYGIEEIGIDCIDGTFFFTYSNFWLANQNLNELVEKIDSLKQKMEKWDEYFI